jgi:hypothetical protein
MLPARSPGDRIAMQTSDGGGLICESRHCRSRSAGLVNSSHKRISKPSTPIARMTMVKVVAKPFFPNRATLINGGRDARDRFFA